MEFSVHHHALVSRDDSEALIAAVEHAATDPRAGIFGPQSMSWRINRESALFLGAGRAALLQLAHPWVATALEQHSSLMGRPIARFHSTFRIVFAMIFGSREQAVAAARHLYTVHTHIRGELSEDVAAWRRGSAYEANEIAALRWVYATLVESAVLAYECVMPPLTPDELAAYFAESKTLAALFGLPAAALPSDWGAFLAYCRAMEESGQLGVSESARAMAHDLLRGAGSWIKPPHWYCSLTTAWLPERFRQRVRAGVWRGRKARGRERARNGCPASTAGFRVSFDSWVRGTRRRRGSRGSAPAPWRDWSNRFWIGQPLLPFEKLKDFAPVAAPSNDNGGMKFFNWMLSF